MYNKTKLNEQVIERACMCWLFSAATTAVATGVGVDRSGFNTAYFVTQGLWGSAGGTHTVAFTLYQTDVSTGTYSIVTSATISGTISTTFTWSLLPTSAAATGTGKFVNLSGLKKFIKVYATITAAVTNSLTISVACILGDGLIEPAV